MGPGFRAPCCAHPRGRGVAHLRAAVAVIRDAPQELHVRLHRARLGQRQVTARGAPLGAPQRRGERGPVGSPAAQQGEAAAVAGHHRHAVVGAQLVEAADEALQGRIAEAADGQRVVDEDEIAARHLGAGRHRRRGRALRRSRRRGACGGLALADLGEVVDRHFLAVDLKPEVGGR